MYRFTRTVTLKHAALTPDGVKFGMGVIAHLKKTFGHNMQLGVEMYGGTRIYWYYDFESFDKIAEMNAKLVGDKKYWTMLAGGTDLWVEGSLQDRVVRLID